MAKRVQLYEEASVEVPLIAWLLLPPLVWAAVLVVRRLKAR